MSVVQQPLRCAVYARVSTREQTEKNQLRELSSYARRRRFRLAHELVDKESGAKEDRKNLLRLMDLARKRQVDVVLVWKFDRFARSTKQLLAALEEFRILGIDFISYTENVGIPISGLLGQLSRTPIASVQVVLHELAILGARKEAETFYDSLHIGRRGKIEPRDAHIEILKR